MKLLTAEEAAELARCTPTTIRRKCATGEIEAYKPAGAWVIPEENLGKWIKESKVAPRQPAGVLNPTKHGDKVSETTFGRHLRAIGKTEEAKDERRAPA